MSQEELKQKVMNLLDEQKWEHWRLLNKISRIPAI